jgi:hypothetical protein
MRRWLRALTVFDQDGHELYKQVYGKLRVAKDMPQQRADFGMLVLFSLSTILMELKNGQVLKSRKRPVAP